MGLLDFIGLSKKEPLSLKWMEVDMHSHLIPGIDDGSKSLKESIALIKRLENLGLKKVITTPHVMTEFYKNTPEIISNGLEKLYEALAKEKVSMEIEAAAEYYLDEIFVEKVANDEPLLTFGDNYILVETGFINKPHILHETLFALETKGYRPILAHPERYMYLQEDPSLLESLLSSGVIMQVNLLSFTGYYGKPMKVLAEKLLEQGSIKFVGTDCHNHRYLDHLELLPNSKFYQKLTSTPFLNSHL
ncbi:capsular polysaccharide biosynthesis protein [Echinicola pacifica]|uniref:protein-tyrosine-phosphatase n=1 Tax=Echinicola pacifica TaxID=346377 RepID=A0A918PQL0_9BACT|nr:CpsB/CapC family capsule biosynthesis tyrosine phosphatase [Echinicola pacifica]GGZ19630.1 capsular polysaccharide biosynthesis protein [Echinicola pacifica]